MDAERAQVQAGSKPDYLRIVTVALIISSCVFIAIDILDTLGARGLYQVRQGVVAALARVFPNGLSLLGVRALMEIDEANIYLEIVTLAPLIPAIVLADWVAHRLAPVRGRPGPALLYAAVLAIIGYAVYDWAILLTFS